MATVNDTDFLGMQEKLGSIAVGKYADIIALLGNPVEDITAFGHINFVLKAGQVVRKTGHQEN